MRYIIIYMTQSPAKNTSILRDCAHPLLATSKKDVCTRSIPIVTQFCWGSENLRKFGDKSGVRLPFLSFAISLPQHLSEVWTRRSNNYRVLSDKCKAQCHFCSMSQIRIRFQSSMYIFWVWGCRYIWGSDGNLLGTAAFFQVQLKTPWWCMVSCMIMYGSPRRLTNYISIPKTNKNIQTSTSNNDFQKPTGSWKKSEKATSWVLQCLGRWRFIMSDRIVLWSFEYRLSN